MQKYRLLIILACFLVPLLILAALVWLWLPGTEEIKNFSPQSTVSLDIINWDDPPKQPIRIWRPIEQISTHLLKAVVLSEDDLFYQHNGVNFDTMIEALKINWQKKRYVRGASTITMQLARNAFLHKRKTLLRKIREIVLARRIEKVLRKKQILEHYLNIVEWGENIFGVEAASQFYFGKSADELTLSEASLLAGMLPNPKYFNPYERPESCRRMQKRVLWLMQISRVITPAQVQLAYINGYRLRGGTLPAQTAAVDSLEESRYTFPEKIEIRPVIFKSDSNNPVISKTDTATKVDTVAKADTSALSDSLKPEISNSKP